MRICTLKKEFIRILRDNKLFRKRNPSVRTIGYILDDDEDKDVVYFIPMQQTSNHQFDLYTNEAMPVKRNFLLDIDISYIDEEEDRDLLRYELQIYDDRMTATYNKATKQYRNGQIKKDLYKKYKHQLQDLEDELYQIEERFRKRNQSYSRSLY